MSPAAAVRSELVEAIDFLEESELALLLEIARRFIPDDVATQEDIFDIQLADEEFECGEYVLQEDIEWK